MTEPAGRRAVMEVNGVQWTTPGDVVAGRRSGVIGVEANPLGQTMSLPVVPIGQRHRTVDALARGRR